MPSHGLISRLDTNEGKTQWAWRWVNKNCQNWKAKRKTELTGYSRSVEEQKSYIHVFETLEREEQKRKDICNNGEFSINNYRYQMTNPRFSNAKPVKYQKTYTWSHHIQTTEKSKREKILKEARGGKKKTSLVYQ